MVLRVCRGTLGDPHDAPDAFPATFLLLVRQAGTVRSRESVGDWLFRIARRVVVRAGIDAATETDHAALIAEVDRLPERDLAAVVLYDVEGLSTEAVARRLGCARGTVLSRLSRAREPPDLEARGGARLGRRAGHQVKRVASAPVTSFSPSRA